MEVITGTNYGATIMIGYVAHKNRVVIQIMEFGPARSCFIELDEFGIMKVLQDIDIALDFAKARRNQPRG